MTTLNVGVFSLPAPVLVAESHGLFSDGDLEVTFTRVASSDEQFRDFDSGRYQLIQTAFDNVASYRLNTGNALGRRIDVQAAFASDAGMNLTVVSASDVHRLEDLRGGVVSVDAKTTGFAFVLFSLLENAGLQPSDYTLVSHGGVATRLERLREGAAHATLLSGGFEVVGISEGLNALGFSRDVVDPYLGSVYAVEGSWYRDNEDLVDRFRAAYEAGLEVVVDPSNRGEVVELIAGRRSVSADLAERILEAELSEYGLTRTTEIDPVAAANVLELRSRFDGFDSVPDARELLHQESGLIVPER